MYVTSHLISNTFDPEDILVKSLNEVKAVTCGYQMKQDSFGGDFCFCLVL